MRRTEVPGLPFKIESSITTPSFDPFDIARADFLEAGGGGAFRYELVDFVAGGGLVEWGIEGMAIGGSGVDIEIESNEILTPPESELVERAEEVGLGGKEGLGGIIPCRFSLFFSAAPPSSNTSPFLALPFGPGAACAPRRSGDEVTDLRELVLLARDKSLGFGAGAGGPTLEVAASCSNLFLIEDTAPEAGS